MPNPDEFVTGELYPAYLEVKIHTEDDLTQLDKLPQQLQRAYYHEFIHYLQFNTTGYGLYWFWYVYDRLRQLLASITPMEGEVIIPLQNEIQQEKKEMDGIFAKLRGSNRLPESIPELVRNAYEIEEIIIQNDPMLDQHFPNLDVAHIMLGLAHPLGDTKGFRFGETAIAETMARLAEFRHYGEDSRLERYPYFVAEDLARREYPSVADTGELLFALCDVALMHPLPGWAFYKLLKRMQETRIEFKSGENVISFGLAEFAKWGWRIPYREEEAKAGFFKSIDDLFHHPAYHETKTWVKTVLENGHELRDNDPFFFVKLFRNQPFTSKMNEVWMHLGGPHCINDKMQRRIRLPQVLESIQDYAQKVYPQRLRMVWQIYELLTGGKVECGLYSVCEHSLPPIVDDRCMNAPWERVHDQQKCPYAAAWIQWGLSARPLLINGVAVDTSPATDQGIAENS